MNISINSISFKYTKTKPEYSKFKKHKRDWRIKSKITPLINLLEKLIILNGIESGYKQLLKEINREMDYRQLQPIHRLYYITNTVKN